MNNNYILRHFYLYIQDWGVFTGLNIGMMQFITKSGKVPRKFTDHVNPVDVQMALNMLVRLYLPKNQNNEPGLHFSMKLILDKATADGVFVHSNSIGKVIFLSIILSDFVLYMNSQFN